MAHEWQKKYGDHGSRFRVCKNCGAQQEWAGDWYAPVGKCEEDKTLAEHILKFMNEYYMGKSTTIRLYNHFKVSSHAEIDAAVDELVNQGKLLYGRTFTALDSKSEGRDIQVVRNG